MTMIRTTMLNYIVRPIIFICLYCGTSANTNNRIRDNFSSVNKYFSSTNEVFRVNSPIRGHCFQICTYNSECVAVMYSSLDRTCTGYKDKQMTNEALDPNTHTGWKRTKCIHIQGG